MGNTAVPSGLMVLLSYGMPILSFTFMSFQSGAVQLYFLSPPSSHLANPAS